MSNGSKQTKNQKSSTDQKAEAKTSDYYELLGLTKPCSDEDIKRAYRKMAIKWHPDKHVLDSDADKKFAEEKFKEINHAYEILSDPIKRQTYDQFGKDAFTHGTGNGDGGAYQFHNANDVFRTFFQSFGTGGDGDFSFDSIPGMSGGFGGRRVHINLGGRSMNGMNGMSGMGDVDSDEDIQKDEPIYTDLNLTLEELFAGTKKKMKISRKIHTGKTTKTESEILEICVKPGWREGTKITFDNKGDVHPGREPAAMIFIVKQKPHAVFIREDNNLVTTLDLSLPEITSGFSKEIIGLDGEKILIEVKKKGIKESNQIHVIKEKGMPIRKEGKVVGRGDVLVKFNIKF
jgi:DnaJ-class molecular chaperone